MAVARNWPHSILTEDGVRARNHWDTCARMQFLKSVIVCGQDEYTHNPVLQRLIRFSFREKRDSYPLLVQLTRDFALAISFAVDA